MDLWWVCGNMRSGSFQEITNDFNCNRGFNLSPGGIGYSRDFVGGEKNGSYTYDDYRSKTEEDQKAEPRDHLRLLATQSLATLREMVIARQSTGNR